MRILILSCSTGEGHNAAGKAVMDCLIENGHEAVMIDMMSLAGPKISRLVGGGYVKIARDIPPFFGFLYKAGMALSNARHKSPVYYANALMARCVKRYLDEEHFDAIVTPHLFPAETLTYMKRKHIHIPKTVVITTDYTCIPFWEETECDYYILPHRDLIEAYVSRGLPREKLLPYGIPVKSSFLKQYDRAEARQKRELPVDKPIFLVMSGSMGYGKLPIFVMLLSKKCTRGEHILVICGNNEKIRKKLRKEFEKCPNIHIIGYTRHVPEYMDMCDVIYTKPGGLTSTEAAVKQIPIIHTKPIPGCENANLAFFVRRGMSMNANKMMTQIAQGKMLLENKEIRRGMLWAQKKNTNPHAAQDIVTLLEAITGEQPS